MLYTKPFCIHKTQEQYHTQNPRTISSVPPLTWYSSKNHFAYTKPNILYSSKKNPASSTPLRTKMQPMQPPLLANELNPEVILAAPEVILAARIVLGLFVLIITLLLAFPRFQRVKLVLEPIFESVWTLVRIVVLFQQSIRDLHQIISMAHDGFQQVVSVLELIYDVVKSLVSLVDQLQRLIRTCRGIWSIWTATQPAAIANEHQNEVPPTDAANGHNDVIVNEELNI